MSIPQYAMQLQYSVLQLHVLPSLQPYHNQFPTPHSYMCHPPYQQHLGQFTASTYDISVPLTAPIVPQTTVDRLLPSSSRSHPAPTKQSQVPPEYPKVLPPGFRAQAYLRPIAPAPLRDHHTDALVPSVTASHSDDQGVSWMNPEPALGTNFHSPYGAYEPPLTRAVESRSCRFGRVTSNADGANLNAKNTMIPDKNTDGRFPCLHCNRTYLHLKHLKRHLLKHTGDHPYMCAVCKNTFSRSDILKCHFQKCSTLLGNPMGVTHLSHSQAHLKRQQAAYPMTIKDEVIDFTPPPNVVQNTRYGGEPMNGNGMDHQQPLEFSRPFPLWQPYQRGILPAAFKQRPYSVQPYADVQHASVDYSSFGILKHSAIQDAKRSPKPVLTNHTNEIDRASIHHPGIYDTYNSILPQFILPNQEPVHTHVDADSKYHVATNTPGPQGGGMNDLYLASTARNGGICEYKPYE